MFSIFREVPEALRELRSVLNDIEDALRSQATRSLNEQDLLERLDALERSRTVWEAEAEAQFLRADSQFKNARNAEERARHIKKSHEADNGDLEGLEEIREAYRQLGEEGVVPLGDAGARIERRLPDMRQAVEGHSPRKATALRIKYE